MFGIIKFLISLRENKPFLCILFFFSYMLGLLAFYLNHPLLIPAVFTFFILIFLFILAFNNVFSRFISKWFILLLYFMFVFGFLNAKAHAVYMDDLQSVIYSKDFKIEGYALNIPKCSYKTKVCKVYLSVKSAEAGGLKYEIKNTKVLASYKDSDIKIKHFDLISLTGVLSQPMRASNPSQFDYQKFLSCKGVLKTFYSNDNPPVLLKSPQLKDIKNYNSLSLKRDFLFNYFTRRMNDIKDLMILKHSKHIKSPRLEILGGVVFGDDAVNPPDEVKESFINSGLLHLLAASGLNVALILSMWFCAIYFLNFNYRLKILSGIFIILLYTFMTGFPPSIVRAAVMLILILIGKLMYRVANGVSLIFAAGLLILFCKPEFIADVGFQLSFLVTLGLIICVPSVTSLFSKAENEYIKRFYKMPDIIKSFMLIFSPVSLLCIFLIPFVAQIWAAPLQAYYFNTFSVYSLFANIAVVPFIGIVSFLGFISAAFCAIPYFDKILYIIDPVLNFFIGIILNISNFFAGLNSSLITVPSPSTSVIVLYFGFIISFFLSVKYLFKNKILNCLALFFLIFTFIFSIKLPDKSFEVIFFNVGNADNALIKTPNDDYVMIDTGRFVRKSVSTAKTVTLEYLFDNNIKKLNTMIITHYDSDHSGGVVDLLNKLKVENIIADNPVCTSNNSCQIAEYFKRNNIKNIKPANNVPIYDKHGVKITNFVPKSSNLRSKNDKSIVTLVQYKDKKFLFMADMGILAYSSIEKYLPPDITVLKTAHHGAKYTVSDKMLQKFKPRYTIISTGKNPYGHPNVFTLHKINKYSKSLSTKEFGAIKFKVLKDGSIKAYYYNSSKKKFLEFNDDR